MSDETLSFDLIHPKPLVVVISGPSGVGKDAVIRSLEKRGLPMHFVVTTTSRAPRPNEVDGVDYNFVSRQRFEEMIAHGLFLEHALVYGDLKGIPKTQISDAIHSGKDVILRVDVQGADTMRRLFPEALLIFLIPTSQKEWLQRLRSRETEMTENLQLRLDTVREELKHLPDYDYVVVNAQDCLEETVDALVAIITAEHHKVHPRSVTI